LVLICTPTEYVSTEAERVDIEGGGRNGYMCGVRHMPTLGQDRPVAKETL